MWQRSVRHAEHGSSAGRDPREVIIHDQRVRMRFSLPVNPTEVSPGRQLVGSTASISHPSTRTKLLTRRRLQVALGLFWLLDAGLQFQPYMFTKAFVTQVLSMNAMYQPDVIGNFIIALARFLAPHAAAWNTVFAAIQLAIGIGLLWPRTVRLALSISFVWVLGVWAIGEGFGRLFTGTATLAGGAPGAVLLYGVVGLLVWPKTSLGEQSMNVSVAGEGVMGERGGRILWTILWFGGAIVQLLPSPYPPISVLVTTINMNLPEPGVLRHLDVITTTFVERAGLPFVLLLVTIEAFVGIYIWRGERWVRPVLWIGILLSVIYWVVGQNFGGIFAGNATDPNAGPLFVLLALTLYPRSPRIRAQNNPIMKEAT